MKILHTSDWHLGLTLGEHDRLPEQKLFLHWLLQTAVEQGVDALLVAGDVYDVVNPSLAAQSLFAEFMVKFYQALPMGQLVVIAGNHDSALRLELPKPFGKALGRIHLVGALDLDSAVIPLQNAAGEVTAWCLAVPYLRASELDCKVLEGESAETAFVRAVTDLYASLRQKAWARNPNLPVISMGHLTVAGSARAGSERVMIGGVESVPVSAVAEGMDYVALGHIHRSQTLGAEQVRYCGSPYAVSFDEGFFVHQVVLVKLSQAGAGVQVQSIPVPSAVEFIRIPSKPGTLAQVQAAAHALDWTSYAHAPRELQPFVEFHFTAGELALDLRKGVEALCAELPIRLAGALRTRTELAQAAEGISSQAMRSLDAPETLLLRHLQRTQTEMSMEVLACFREAVTLVQTQGSEP